MHNVLRNNYNDVIGAEFRVGGSINVNLLIMAGDVRTIWDIPLECLYKLVLQFYRKGELIVIHSALQRRTKAKHFASSAYAIVGHSFAPFEAVFFLFS